MPDLDAPPPAPPAEGDAALAQVASDIKVVQQQALATQRTIDQLQAQHEAPAHADTWSTTTVLSAAGWGGVGVDVGNRIFSLAFAQQAPHRHMLLPETL